MNETILIEYEDFDKFIEDILPGKKLWKQLQGFIFRGLSSEAYELYPTSMRLENREKLHLMGKATLKYENFESYMSQFSLEILALKQFYNIANQNGLPLPYVASFSASHEDVISQELRKPHVKDLCYTQDILELACLAQHHGIPTKMLDWSFDIFVALYFASLGSVLKENIKENIAIFAINMPYIQTFFTSDFPLKFIVPRYSINNNIKLQKGILSYWEFSNDEKLANKISRNPMDAMLNEYLDSIRNEWPIIYKILIPAKLSSYIFSFVNDLGYSASRLFEGYDGVVREMKEFGNRKPFSK